MCLIADKRLRQASPKPLRVLLSCLRISFVRYDCRKLALCRPLAASARLLCEVSACSLAQVPLDKNQYILDNTK